MGHELDLANGVESQAERPARGLPRLTHAKEPAHRSLDPAVFEIQHELRHVVVIGQNLPNDRRGRVDWAVDVHDDLRAVLGDVDYDVRVPADRPVSPEDARLNSAVTRSVCALCAVARIRNVRRQHGHAVVGPVPAVVASAKNDLINALERVPWHPHVWQRLQPTADSRARALAAVR